MIIPHTQLSPEALRGLIEDFVTRDGTDYGAVEATLEAKVVQVRAQLDSGQAVILYDPHDRSFTIVVAEQAREVDDDVSG